MGAHLRNQAELPLQRVEDEHNFSCPAKTRLVRVDVGIRVERKWWPRSDMCMDALPLRAIRAHRMTAQRYRDMLKAQGGVCALCPDGFNWLCCEPVPLAVDHDHACCAKRSCGLCVRGLLCGNCGQFVSQHERYPERRTNHGSEQREERAARVDAYLAAYRALRAARD
ncbi:endonuclease domain-containing protein [Paractinoplanes lichenicola]|uniref:Recombination endonuclease VII n=1 Tax=Paractinoplanes lichenicola TaxID=2802976 RepID=A0ABS1W5Z8_9ACTN|nr:endonuclease domain-containing protein [Actinoplanes lichenicola]MBL7262142.1 hypothetical protein [Actinoplanes lichenicola]